MNTSFNTGTGIDMPPVQPPEDEAPSLVVAPKNWAPLRLVFRQFIAAHPELGLRATQNTYNTFTRVHGPALVAMDVLRKAGLRSPYIADVNRFDAAAFELVSRCGYAQSAANHAA